MSTTTLLHANRWISLYSRNGWVFASRRPPGAPITTDAVTVIALHSDREGGRNAPHRLVVIEEYRVSVEGWEFGLPAGLLDSGERIAGCAGRELAEETGLKLVEVLETSGLTFSSPGLCDESQAFAVVRCTGTPSLNPGVDGEQIRVHLLSQSGCRDLLARNAAGSVAITARAWPLLVAVAHTGTFAGVAIAP